ncbi:membrane dipeptidase-domain-containing protein [Hygrophoropsis aurantiaca]|uniref:Membrane dipeptidase-domain-containing protein n=1 Tax=Hygrophoropsis aurantiaca TaxID=72124 RepID=A0ACB8AG49_9AGAM|nr:membrane dipeptidase-domain-containing protein [Hygrophoropsis aurantiaca]
MTGETDPLIQANGQRNYAHDDSEFHEAQNKARALKIRMVVWGVLLVVFIVGVVLALVDPGSLRDLGWSGKLPRDPDLAAQRILNVAPVIDGHIDLPMVARFGWQANVSAVPLDKHMPLHVDIPRLRQGKVGGFFWSLYVECPKSSENADDFLTPSWRVRDTLEQIDVSRGLIEKYPDTFTFAASSDDVKSTISDGKIAGLFGIEGGHQIGNSIGALRQFYTLGVRYMTLTHICHNAFADSGGYLVPFEPLHGGLSPLGFKLVEEMNRLGMLVDLSHTSDLTATQAIKHSKAPVMWSHSSARAVHNVARNVPDDILKLIGTGKGQKDGVVMVNFSPAFVAPEGEANIKTVADHVEHIAKVAGKEYVGIGSDYDGIGEVPKGLEDVSKYPALISELYSRGWNKLELAGLTGGNFLRVFEGVERVSKELRAAGTPVVYDIYDERTDLPRGMGL